MMRGDALIHGGDIVFASKQYGIAKKQWVDLSTGINPNVYPVDFSAEDFSRLPYLQESFYRNVCDYYQQEHFLAVSGTQAAIQILPECLKELPVLLPEIGYQEHAHYWCHHRQYEVYRTLNIDDMVLDIEDKLSENSAQHVVVINPNNPTGIQLSVEQLNHIASTLTSQACLIVDEAFIDVKPEASILNTQLSNNIIVLRSFGKFFGLAGLRLGFVFAKETICHEMAKKLGIWQVNGPAQAAAIQALADKHWQSHAINEIKNNAAFTRQIFAPLAGKFAEEAFIGSELFTSYLMDKKTAHSLCEAFARKGILLRVIDVDKQQALLRIGILKQDDELAAKRLTQLISNIVENEEIIPI